MVAFLFAGLRIGTENGIRNENARGDNSTFGRLQTSDAVVTGRQEPIDVQRKDDSVYRRIAQEG